MPSIGEDKFDIKIKANDLYSSELKRMESKFSKASIAIAGSIAGIGASILAMTKKTADAGEEFAKWSKTTGVATKSLSELAYATRVLGGDQEKLFDVLKETAVRMKEAQDGTGPLRDNLKHLGIEFQNVDGTLRDTETVFFELVNSLNQIEDQALKVAIADEIWSDAGTELLDVLGRNTDEIEKLRKEANELGVVFDQEAVRASQEFNKSMRELDERMKGLSITVGTYLIPKFNAFIADWEDGFKNLTRGNEETKKTTESLDSLTKKIDEQRDRLNKLNQEYEQTSFYDGFRRQALASQTSEVRGNIAALNEQRAALVEQQKQQEQLKAEAEASPTGLSGKLKLEEDLARELVQLNFNIDQELQSAQWEAENIAYEARQQAIDDEIAQYNLGFEEEYNLVVAQNERIAVAALDRHQYEEKLRRESLRATQRNEKLKYMAIRQGTASTISLLESLNTLAGEKHKEYFELLKVARIAEASINTYAGATRALAEFPYPYSLIVAGLVTAAGLAQIAVIAGQQFDSGGGGGGGAASIGGGTGSTAQVSETPTAPQTTQPQQQAVGLTIQINNPIGTEDWDRIVEDDIAPAIRRATDRNVEFS